MSSGLLLTITHTLPDEFDIVYKALLDFKKFGELHPYMKEVTVMEDKSPEFIEYLVKEEIYFFGFIKNHPMYTARVMEVEKNKHIRYTSPVKKYIFLTVDFTFSKAGSGALLVQEEIKLVSNKLIGTVFLNILRKAHLQFFENLRRLLHNSIEDHKF